MIVVAARTAVTAAVVALVATGCTAEPVGPFQGAAFPTSVADPSSPAPSASSSGTTDATPSVRAPSAPPSQTRVSRPASPRAVRSATASPQPFAIPRRYDTVAFSSPSGNLRCYIFHGFAECDVRDKRWEAPPQPKSCAFDWGKRLVVSRERSMFSCYSDGLPDTSTVLPYGRIVRDGGIACTSETRGMTCVHERTKRGFTVSQGSYRLF